MCDRSDFETETAGLLQVPTHHCRARAHVWPRFQVLLSFTAVVAGAGLLLMFIARTNAAVQTPCATAAVPDSQQLQSNPVVPLLPLSLSKLVFLSNPDYQIIPLDSTWKDAQRRDCPFHCEFTSDFSELAKADAAIFYVKQPTTITQAQMQSFEKPNGQIWAFATGGEAALSSWLPVKPLVESLQGKFDWTVGYSASADIFWPVLTSRMVRQSEIDLQTQLSGSNVNYPSDQASNRKSTLLIWYTSNCNSNSAREAVWENIAKYLPANRTIKKGACAPGPVPANCKGTYRPISNACMVRDVMDSKFYAAFENTLCQGYITEKFMRGYRYGVVPLAYGGYSREDYELLVDPKSFIHVNDFKSYRELAEYLLYLDQNETAYREYFRWREKYVMLDEHMQMDSVSACNFCRHVHMRATRGKDTCVDQQYRSVDAGLYHCNYDNMSQGCDLPGSFSCNGEKNLLDWFYGKQCHAGGRLLQ